MDVVLTWLSDFQKVNKRFPYVGEIWEAAYSQGQFDYQNNQTQLSPKTYLEFSKSLTDLKTENQKLNTELQEVKSFLSQLMQCTDAYDFWADECEEIIKKYYGGNLQEWDKTHDK